MEYNLPWDTSLRCGRDGTDMREQEQKKVSFQGTIESVQPRSNVWRYRLDNRTHSMTGYNLFLSGIADGEGRDFAIAISEKQQEKYKFHIGDEIKGTGWTKKYPEWEYADYYRTGALKKLQENNVVPIKDGSPWLSEVPELSVYYLFLSGGFCGEDEFISEEALNDIA